ncbi:uncharacterized protein MEPE_00013 [Melanopsichium pennsylvanicum]|uniref:Uncharacterized protein n=2 Tax=Melanopsichium pennsylvanicum TaxID=63383 RepID=A0AAJ4XHI4_9BASI|nr:hypothetical protein BN887_01931 [Melanopsichium pennsylvanicum 4]SNX81308.1 uncharacterized protein MEPE_00013 [Melanopsichium pennsylvanicum]
MLAAEPPFHQETITTDTGNELLTIAHAERLSAILDEPLSSRLSIFAYYLGSSESHFSTLTSTLIPRPLYLLCLVLRYLVLKEHQSLGESSKRFNWSLKQLHAAVVSGYRSFNIHEKLRSDPTLTSLPSSLSYPDPLSVDPTTRDIHLQSGVQLTLLSAYQLAQSLLLTPEPFSAPPSALVLGSMFHKIAQSTDEATRESIKAISSPTENAMLDWILHDTEEYLAIDVEALRKAKRDRKKHEKKSQLAIAEADKNRKVAQKQAAARSGFGLLQLDDQEAEQESDKE